jgi:hypothetical protein
MQPLRVPDQISLAHYGQLPPENHPKLTFLLSEQGIDAYRIGDSPTSVLFVFQDDKMRRATLQFFIDQSQANSGLLIDGVRWCCFQTGIARQDWKPIVNFKYATFEFGWSAQNPSDVMIRGGTFYAAQECYAAQKSPGTLISSEIGSYSNLYGGAPLPHDNFLYRAALAAKRK